MNKSLYNILLQQFGSIEFWRFSFLFLIVLTGCNTIEVDEPNYQLTSSTVFEEDATAEAAVLGIYTNMMLSEGFVSGSYQSITTVTGLASDDLIDYSFNPVQRQFFENAILPSNPTVEFNLWNEAYKYIYHANSVLEGLENSGGITPAVHKRLMAETLFIRAFCYFHLVNLFGEVPLVTATDYEINSSLQSASLSEIYELILEDLTAAIEGLPVDYAFAGGEKVRPNHSAALALKSRVHLYLEEWEQAAADATLVIDQGSYNLPEDLNSVFLANSDEAILQFKSVIPNVNTKEGRMFVLQFTPFHVALREDLVNSFEPNDLRRTEWIDSLSTNQTYYYPAKYKVLFAPAITEYSMVLRLAEQYLIRAEARANLGNIEGSLEDMNTIRARAGLSPLENLSVAQLTEAIFEERRHELFTERGHRWYDLKRTGRASETLSPIKQQWQDTDVLFPIPQNELSKNPNLEQNAGY